MLCCQQVKPAKSTSHSKPRNQRVRTVRTAPNSIMLNTTRNQRSKPNSAMLTVAALLLHAASVAAATGGPAACNSSGPTTPNLEWSGPSLQHGLVGDGSVEAARREAICLKEDSYLHEVAANYFFWRSPGRYLAAARRGGGSRRLLRAKAVLAARERRESLERMRAGFNHFMSYDNCDIKKRCSIPLPTPNSITNGIPIVHSDRERQREAAPPTCRHPAAYKNTPTRIACAEQGGLSILLLEWLRKRCDHPAQGRTRRPCARL